MTMMSKTELHNILFEMVEHVDVGVILDELIAGMSIDELRENVEHLDRHLFENHFLTRED